MLTTRLWMGSVLIALTVGMLAFDQHINGYPFQFAFQMGCAVLGCRELFGILGPRRTVHRALAFVGVVGLTFIPWARDGGRVFLLGGFDVTPPAPWRGNPAVWAIILGAIVFLHMAIFLVEMSKFRESGASIERMARTWWIIAYLGLLPSGFAQLRWLYPRGSEFGTAALALAIFVPKGCDIGAYFTGRLIGKHPMTPVLSPKKTWEGAIGGLTFAAWIAIVIDRYGPAPILRENWGIEVAFGLSVGLAGMFGDLSESLIKRDCQQKDASQTVPGFGGVLDVVDAVIFAAPVAYFWFLILLALNEQRPV